MTKARDLANASTALSAVSATELAFVDGVTSATQTQMDAKAPSSTAVTLTGTQTLTNKTLTSPVISSVINNTLTSTTGDIIYASAANTPARLGIGSTSQVLSVSGGVPAWATVSGAPDFLAGKNKVINGDFSINQRAFTSTTTDAYGLDRWKQVQADGTSTYSVQTFTLGAAPVTGYEAKNFARVAISGQTLNGAATILIQPIESVRTFANQTVTISFYAKANSGTPKIAIELQQYFGTGGSPSATVNTYAGQATISTSFARYSITGTVPSISGKTIGSNNNDALNLNIWTSSGSDTAARTGSIGIQNNTFDIWGVQIEAGSTATPFTTATGTLQGELAACQRYYYRSASSSASRPIGFHLYGQSATSGQAVGMAKVTMRVAPTSLEFSSLKSDDPGDAAVAITAFTMGNPTDNCFQCDWSVASGSANGGNYILQTNTGGGYLAFSAEL